MEYKFNPIHDKTPAGACVKGTAVTYALKVARNVPNADVFFVQIDDKDNTVKKLRMPLDSCDGTHYTFRITIEYKNPGLFWYYFMVGSTYLCKTPLFDIEPRSNIGASFAQLVYDRSPAVDENFNTGIIYHIFVDRFKKAGALVQKSGMLPRNDWGGSLTKNTTDFLVLNKEYFGGNLEGIIEKMPYIKSLGTKSIFLSPIFESSSYHKYDTADFENVDTAFGGNAAFTKLLDAAKQHDMRIILDGVFNHVGSDSIYFNKLGRYDSLGAYQSKKSPYYDWFMWEDFPDKYSSWWGIDTLPQFNETNKSLQQYIAGPSGIISKHMRNGVLGFRLDVVDEVTDNYLDLICARIRKQKPNALILGEVWEDAATKISYDKRRSYFNGSQLNSVMNYPLKNGIIEFVTRGDAEGLAGAFFMLQDHYPKHVQNNVMNFLGTHDTKRILTALTERKGEKAPDYLKIAGAIQYCAPGVPAIFYGDEAGVRGGEAPFCRVCYPWGKEDKDILAWYKKLGKLREKDVFVSGDCRVQFFHDGVFVFERTDKTTRVVVAANCGIEHFRLNVTQPMRDFETAKTVKDNVLLKPGEFVILIKEDIQNVETGPEKRPSYPGGTKRPGTKNRPGA